MKFGYYFAFFLVNNIARKHKQNIENFCLRNFQKLYKHKICIYIYSWKIAYNFVGGKENKIALITNVQDTFWNKFKATTSVDSYVAENRSK